MNWWMNFYFAEGPGIAKDTPAATGLKLFSQTLSREWWNLILLNVIFLTAALPIVTIPAALVAMVRVTSLMVQDEPCEPWRDFRETFFAEFWTATVGGSLIAGVIAIGFVAASAYAEAALSALIYAVPLAITFAVTTLAVIFAVLFAHLVANYHAPSMTLVKAAGIAVFLNPLPVLAALAANLALWLIHIAAYPSTILLAVTINFSLGALLLTFAARKSARTAFHHITRIEAEQQSYHLGKNPRA